ncbi:hypothetical protein FRB91_011380 [Serendipita sp. 411]|nr:hypothetical protein FRB91_011380 [Serendipita sp. 411]
MTTLRDSSKTLLGEKVVVVLGPAAAGKTTVRQSISYYYRRLIDSQLINTLIGRGDEGISHSLKSGTTKIECIKSPRLIEGQNITFIDTPGFDDAAMQDTDILHMLKEFFEKAECKPYIVLYLYPISNRRLPSSELKRLKLLAGSWVFDKVPNVVMVTTMWDRVDQAVGEEREKELEHDVWGQLIARGHEVKRFDCTSKSALDILRTTQNNIKSSAPTVSVDRSIETTQTKRPQKRRSALQTQLRALFQRLFGDS